MLAAQMSLELCRENHRAVVETFRMLLASVD